MTLETMDSLDFGVDRSTEVGRFPDWIEEAERKERTNSNSREQRGNLSNTKRPHSDGEIETLSEENVKEIKERKERTKRIEDERKI